MLSFQSGLWFYVTFTFLIVITYCLVRYNYIVCYISGMCFHVAISLRTVIICTFLNWMVTASWLWLCRFAVDQYCKIRLPRPSRLWFYDVSSLKIIIFCFSVLQQYCDSMLSISSALYFYAYLSITNIILWFLVHHDFDSGDMWFLYLQCLNIPPQIISLQKICFSDIVWYYILLFVLFCFCFVLFCFMDMYELSEYVILIVTNSVTWQN